MKVQKRCICYQKIAAAWQHYLENRTGNTTTIQMHENKKDAFYKQDTDQNGHQQQQQTKDEQQQRHQKQKQQDAMDFLQQMRLGLV